MRSPIFGFTCFSIFSILVSGCGESNSIDMVKESTLNRYSDSITIGNAFDNWKHCESIEWDDFKSERNEQFVQYKCYNSGDSVRELSGIDFSKAAVLSDSDYEKLKASTSWSPSQRNASEVMAETAYIYEKVDHITYMVIFSIAADGQSFRVRRVGFEVKWEDGTKSTSMQSNYILREIYNNGNLHPLTASIYRGYRD